MKNGYRIALCSVVTISLCTAESTAGFAHEHSKAKTAQESAHDHPESDRHSAADRKRNIEANIPISIRHDGSGPAGPGRKTFRIVPGGHQHVLTAKRSFGSDNAGRNAIGVPIVRPAIVQPANALPIGHPQTPPGLASSASGHFMKPVTIQHAVLPPSPPPSILSGGAIGGVSVMPRRTAGLGGPSMPIGRIDGTTFPLKH